ncbi:MAG: hypothetical protein WB622_20815 [Acidobacteriaceae bacterium]
MTEPWFVLVRCRRETAALAEPASINSSTTFSATDGQRIFFPATLIYAESSRMKQFLE